MRRTEKRDLRNSTELPAPRYKLLIVDELGYVGCHRPAPSCCSKFFNQRYERGSTIVTSNLPFDEWTGIFSSERLTGALLDRSPITFTSSR